jgi:hypothetical protein
MIKSLSRTCLVLGLLSFFLSPADEPHAERFGIFVGLWAPTFLLLPSAVRAAID